MMPLQQVSSHSHSKVLVSGRYERQQDIIYLFVCLFIYLFI